MKEDKGKDKDREIFRLTAKYLSAYIRELTDGKEEVFIAITDINAEMLPDEYLLPVEGCRFVRAEQEDYADAVRYRNDGEVKKLVLLCSDSIRRIDSLKDFIEYPIIPDDMAFLGYACKYDRCSELGNKDWVEVTATVHREFWKDYNGEGPVLHAVSVEPTKKPKDEILNFS